MICPNLLPVTRSGNVTVEVCGGTLIQVGTGPDAYLECDWCGATWSDGKEPDHAGESVQVAVG